MDIQCYGQRMLNPFRGIINVIKYKAAEAVTTDGIRWDIYVKNESLLSDVHDKHKPSKKIQISEIRYASWTRAGGIKYGRRYQSEDYTRMAAQGDVLYQKILEINENLPFPLQDNYELWLLDRQLQPLALLDSAITVEEVDLDTAIDWRAGIYCKQAFRPLSLDNDSIGDYAPIEPQASDPQPSSNKITSAADRLTEIVNEAAGPIPVGQWFCKHSHNSKNDYYVGLEGINLGQQYIGRQLPGKVFPAGVLAINNFDGKKLSLLKEYLDWLAPCDLLRQDLTPETRKNIELLAAPQALVIEKQFRLYPEIIDQDVINAARVQAKLQEDETTMVQDEDLIHNFYTEVGANG